MQGPSHLLVGWYFADALRFETPRERRIVAWSSVAPDVDVIAYGAAILWYRLDKDLAFEKVWSVIHHRYTHGLAFVLATGVVAWCLARGPSRARVALAAMTVSALHNFLDVVMGGPTWPVYPAWPLSDLGWTANWSYTLAEWPNHVVLFACLAAMFAYARLAGRSPMELFGARAERWFVAVSRGERAHGAGGSRRLRIAIWIGLALLAIAALAPLGFNPGG